ncbi:hypothetical protein H5410_047891 [Solanum commersonii]|uniref:Uncharacterized protein n=1 Tax=Solanum commersonii TaxID=4109 RepID=A0A9J5XGG6_SOLCO|nr:hypothetical protein H5410_047891 [Solanum commersonii]
MHIVDVFTYIHIQLKSDIAGKRTGPDQQDRFYRNRSSLPDFATGTGSYRNRFYRKFPMVPSGPLVTGLEPDWNRFGPDRNRFLPDHLCTGNFYFF